MSGTDALSNVVCPPFYKENSLKVCDVLENIGASTDMRECMIECGKVDEVLGAAHSLLPGVHFNFSCHCVGSYYEGTQTRGMNSDIDQVVVIEVPVVSNHFSFSNSLEQEPCLLMVQDINTPPGYAKLCAFEGPIVTHIQTIYGNVIEIVTDKYNQSVIKLKEKSLPNYLCDIKQGPAFKSFGQSGVIEQDYVFAFRHKEISGILKQWFHRQKGYGCPNEQLKKSCVSMGFLLVNTGHRKSEEHNVEWRISFSLQERLLVTNFNPVQLKCFILLKLIKKEIVQKLVQCEALSSYHLKTCMFYVIENTPSQFWTQENLLACLASCLKLLLLWVENGNCPNYFNPSENMFDGRLNRQVRGVVQYALKKLLSLDAQYLTHIKCDDIGQNLIREILPNLIFSTTDIIEVKHRLKLSIYRTNVLSVLRIRNSILFRNHDSNHEKNIENLLNFVHRLKVVESLSGNTPEDTKKALALVLPQLELNLISNCLALEMKKKDKSNILWNCLMSNKWNEIGAQSDFVSAKLKQATFLYVCGHYAASLHIAESLRNTNFHSVCFCENQNAIYPDLDALALSIPPGQNITMNYHVNGLLTPCIVFLPHEGAVLPPPLKYEMLRAAGLSLPRAVTFGKEWFTWIVLDAQVLLHFLLYLNHKKMNMTSHIRKDIENMMRVIKNEDCKISHIETALNLLGWIHYREQMPEKAAMCYTQSEFLQPKYNASKWHLHYFELEAQRVMNSLFPMYEVHIFRSSPSTDNDDAEPTPKKRRH